MSDCYACAKQKKREASAKHFQCVSTSTCYMGRKRGYLNGQEHGGGDNMGRPDRSGQASLGGSA